MTQSNETGSQTSDAASTSSSGGLLSQEKRAAEGLIDDIDRFSIKGGDVRLQP